MCLKPLIALFDFVALRKESVDRNILLIPLITLSISRSPQGERG